MNKPIYNFFSFGGWCKSYHFETLNKEEVAQLRQLYKYLKDNEAIEIKDIQV